MGRIIPGLDGEIFYSDLDQTVFDRPGLDGGHTGLCPNPNWGSEPAHKPLYPLNRLAKSRCQRLFISTKMKFRLQRINHPLFSVTSFTVSSLNISPYCDLYSTRYVTNLREAPLKLAAPLFGHCPNSDYTHTHTPHSNGHLVWNIALQLNSLHHRQSLNSLNFPQVNFRSVGKYYDVSIMLWNFCSYTSHICFRYLMSSITTSLVSIGPFGIFLIFTQPNATLPQESL